VINQPATSKNKRKYQAMNIMDREDIYEQNEIEKHVDVETISFDKLMGIFIGFCSDVLLTKENLDKLNLDNNMETILRNYTYKGKAFLDKNLSYKALQSEGVSAWEEHDRIKDGNASKRLLRVIMCCLVDEEEAMFDSYGAGEVMGAFLLFLFELGPGYCRQFRYYIQDNLI